MFCDVNRGWIHLCCLRELITLATLVGFWNWIDRGLFICGYRLPLNPGDCNLFALDLAQCLDKSTNQVLKMLNKFGEFFAHCSDQEQKDSAKLMANPNKKKTFSEQKSRVKPIFLCVNLSVPEHPHQCILGDFEVFRYFELWHGIGRRIQAAHPDKPNQLHQKF